MIPQRRDTPTVWIGAVPMGSQHPIVIQSMTNTATADVAATVSQIKELVTAGSELVRLTVNDFDAMAAIPEIVDQLEASGITVPLVGDFHYNGHVLLTKYPKSAASLSKFRINPGNVGKGSAHYDHFDTMIKVAIDLGKAVRIGVNFGSLDPDVFTQMMNENASKTVPDSFKEVVYRAMIHSALDSLSRATTLGLGVDRLVISTKMSDVQDLIAVYQRLAAQCPHVIHLGLTEAGGGLKGVASSAAALSVLLQQGIGDTIRVSLTPEPGTPRSQEVSVCKTLLQSMGFRYFMPSVTSCPGCGRTNSDRFVKLAQSVGHYIESRMPYWKTHHPGVEQMVVAVMGCVVNGPGESKHANIGISFPGSSEKPGIPVYQDGQLTHTLRGDKAEDAFFELLETYVSQRYQPCSG